MASPIIQHEEDYTAVNYIGEGQQIEGNEQESEDEEYIVEELISEGDDPELNAVASISTEEFLKDIKLTVFIREFKGQTSGRNIGIWKHCCTSIEEFREWVWNKSKPFIKRQVIYEEGQDPVFHEDVTPEIEGDLFLLFNDKTQKKSNRFLSEICDATLELWSKEERDILLYIHQYSLSMANRKIFELTKSKLILPQSTDRSGATSQTALNELVAELKEKHGLRYKAADIQWIQWANQILASDAHLREQMINGRPPIDILSFFRPHDSVQMRRHENDVHISRRVNDGLHREFLVMKERFNSMKLKLYEEMDDVEDQLKIFEARLDQNANLLTAVGESIRPQESDFSSELLGRIANQEDVDHVDENII